MFTVRSRSLENALNPSTLPLNLAGHTMYEIRQAANNPLQPAQLQINHLRLVKTGSICNSCLIGSKQRTLRGNPRDNGAGVHGPAHVHVYEKFE